MIFYAFHKNLVLNVVRPWTEVQSGIPIFHEGKSIHFVKHYYETNDKDEIEWLLKFKDFSETPNVVGKIWIYVPPEDPKAIIEAKDKKIAELEAKLSEALPPTDKTNEKKPAKKEESRSSDPAL